MKILKCFNYICFVSDYSFYYLSSCRSLEEEEIKRKKKLLSSPRVKVCILFCKTVLVLASGKASVSVCINKLFSE